MLKGKKIKIAYTIGLLLLIVAALIATTFAWFPDVVSDDVLVELYAGGCVILNFRDEISQTTEGGLKPAKEMPLAIAENRHMDVKTLYNSSDANPSYISSTATTVTYTATVSLEIGDLDENGDPIPQNLVFGIEVEVETLDGRKIPLTAITSAGASLNSSADLITDLSMTIDYGDNTYGKEDGTQITTANPAEIPNIDVQFSNQEYQVIDDCTLSITLSAYISQPLGLMDPALDGGKVNFYVNIKALTTENLPGSGAII